MNILWFNWRDIENPESGGAEIYTHEIARRLIKSGYNITLFTSCFTNCANKTSIDGVNIIRDGNRYTVYEKARSFYKKNASHYDLVVDEINTRPFNTPRYVEGEILALIHQLAMEFWIYETPFPLSLIGPFLERLWLRPYRMIPTVTVSRSTKDDLARLGFREVYIVHNGLNVKPLSRLPEKRAEPTIIYVGRMKRAKRPQDVIDAFRVVRKEVPDARLWMVGEGYLREKLQQEAGEGVVFYGYVERDHLRCLLTQAWVIAVPGVREGWGQVVTDANALGTPAVGYDIPGLRDSIVHGHTGILTSSTVHALAEALIRILTDHGLRRRLSLNALEWARKFDWDRSAQRFEEVVQLVTSR